MTASFKVSDEVRDVLARSTIDANTVCLPEQLERSLYVAVDKVLKGVGGKWDRRQRVHVFERDPRELLGLAVETGRAVNVKNALQAFYTPPEIARRVAEAAELAPHQYVLEPSAGHGALIRAALDVEPTLRVEAHEIDPYAMRALNSAFPRIRTVLGDFLSMPCRYRPSEKIVDRVLMNPPFTGGQDVEHVAHAMLMVKPGGILVAIVSAGAGRGRDWRSKGFARLLEACGERQELPENAFEASGTGVRTSLVKFRLPVRS